MDTIKLIVQLIFVVGGLQYFNFNQENVSRDFLAFNCFSNLDTCLSNGNCLKYLGDNDSIDLYVQIKGEELIFPWGLNCDVPSNYVPALLKFDENSLVLVRGAGFTFREVIYFYNLNDSIYCKRCETMRYPDAVTDFYVYPVFNNSGVIKFIDVKDVNLVYDFVLPNGIEGGELREAILVQDSVELIFSNNSRIEVNVNEFNFER